MTEEFANTVELVQKNLENCPWIQTQSTVSYAEKLFEEVDELKAALAAGDYSNCSEELGDLIWDAVMLAFLAEREGHFKAKDVLRGINEKIKRRKPYIPAGKTVSLEEACRIWAERKAAE